MSLAEFIKQTEGRKIRDQDGEHVLRLMPPVSEYKMEKLGRTLPCSIPAEIRELFAVTRGYEDGPYGGINFAGYPAAGFEFRSVFPCELTIMPDGCGNFWVIDLTKQSTVWGPIFFVCHDPPVVVYQAGDLREFVEEWLKLEDEKASKLGDPLNRAVMKVWTENPGIISYENAIQSSDSEVRTFAESTGDSFHFVDLRQAVLGDGFSCRARDVELDYKLDGDNLLFAIRKPPPKKPFLQRIFGR